MKKQSIEYPQEKIDRLNDYFDGEERRSQKQNGENINWIEMLEEEVLEIEAFLFNFINKLIALN